MSDLVGNVQYRAGKIISGAIQRTSIELVHSKFGWTSLKDRRYKQRLRVMYIKMVHNDSPSYCKLISAQNNMGLEQSVSKYKGSYMYYTEAVPTRYFKWKL